jgi:hypothetical protein
MSDENKLVVTAASKLRQTREKGVILPFPSGNAYRVRPPTVAGLLRRGDLPNVLLGFVVDAFYNGTDAQKVQSFLSAGEKRESALALLDSFRVVCEEMWMEPKIVAKPEGDSEIAIEDVPPEDQLFAFQVTFLGVEVAQPFREQSGADVESLPSPQDVSPPTE